MFAFLVLSISELKAQWQTETYINEMSYEKKGGYYVITINIKKDGSTDARSPKLIVNLPPNTEVNGIRFPDNRKDIPYQVLGNKSQVFPSGYNPTPTDGCIVFDLPNLQTKADHTFVISITETTDRMPTQTEASAYLFSITPEKNKENNFKIIKIIR